MTARSLPDLWAITWRPLGALCAAAASTVAVLVFFSIERFDDYFEVYAWYLAILILAACSLRLARDAWRQARQRRLGRAAIAVTVAAAALSGVVSLVLIIGVLLQALSIGGEGGG